MSELPALMFGRPGFFTPRTLLDWFSFGNLVSYYDTSVLKGRRSDWLISIVSTTPEPRD
jgi:hypothetical protein